jgi:trans-aconitate methyltransferase
VLELACGPGVWTGQLLGHASSFTGLDASPEMLARAATRYAGDRVRFIQADIFSWSPDRRCDVVFFGFWLSHVPLELFHDFWSIVADCLRPGGRVFFVDDSYRSDEELIEGAASSVIQRRTRNGTSYRAVKVPHEPAALESLLHRAGWEVTVSPASGPFYWGAGTRAASAVGARDPS